MSVLFTFIYAFTSTMWQGQWWVLGKSKQDSHGPCPHRAYGRAQGSLIKYTKASLQIVISALKKNTWVLGEDLIKIRVEVVKKIQLVKTELRLQGKQWSHQMKIEGRVF